MKTNEIADIVIKSLLRRGFPIFLTSYEGQGIWEADVFGVNRNGYTYEYEIKRSRADFKAEFRNKKAKHERFAARRSTRMYDEWKNGKRTGDKYELIIMPNRYFFICPDGLIKPEEVPEYAGLIYADHRYYDSMVEVKKAPLLHRNKANSRVYERVATILSMRTIFGSSYMTYLKKKK